MCYKIPATGGREVVSQDAVLCRQARPRDKADLVSHSLSSMSELAHSVNDLSTSI